MTDIERYALACVAAAAREMEKEYNLRLPSAETKEELITLRDRARNVIRHSSQAYTLGGNCSRALDVLAAPSPQSAARIAAHMRPCGVPVPPAIANVRDHFAQGPYDDYGQLT